LISVVEILFAFSVLISVVEASLAFSLLISVVEASFVLLLSSIIISSGSGARAKNSSPLEYI
jgi:hypothetical protein